MRPLTSSIAAVALALVFAAPPVRADEPEPSSSAGPQLPESARKVLDEFRNIPWGEHLKPERGDPPRDGWQKRLETEWVFGALDDEYVPALEALLKDRERFVRALAARSLGVMASRSSTPVLIDAVNAERDPITRYTMVEALARTGGDGALEAIEALQEPGTPRDLLFIIGTAWRHLKGGRYDTESIRAEHREAVRTRIPSAEKRKPAPELALPSPNGPVNLSVHRGDVILLMFTHGDRGREDGPALNRLQRIERELKVWGVTVIVVDPHEKERTALWQARMRVPYLFCSDPSGRAQGAYGVGRQLVANGEWLPSPGWFVIDRKGRLAWSRIGTKAADLPSVKVLKRVLEDVAHGIRVE